MQYNVVVLNNDEALIQMTAERRYRKIDRRSAGTSEPYRIDLPSQARFLLDRYFLI